ncbi:MAG: DUF302 domain-containing protein [Acidobacteria bacterium]|nr:DUF302 domain-containing protein [Acidobacteriota bacterium]
MGYGCGRWLDTPFDNALDRARNALKSEGFGVLCEIDIDAKFREKLGVEFTRYKILGACNPSLAYQALGREMDLGLLLPCNVIVYEKEGGSFVAAIDAAKMLALVGNADLAAVAGQVNDRLRRVIDTL